MAIPINTLIIMVVAAIFLGALLPTIASNMSDSIIGNTLSLTSANIPADIYVNDSANTTEFQIRWDISTMKGKSASGLNITSATLRLCNTTDVNSSLNITRIVNQTWTETESATSYKALTLGISENFTFTTTTGCINVQIFKIVNPDRSNSYTSFKISSNDTRVVRANVNTIFNTTSLYINDTAATQVRFRSSEATTNTPTLTIIYEFSIPSSTQVVYLLVPLFVVIFIVVAFVKFRE